MVEDKEWSEGDVEYSRDSILLLVEKIDNSMVITDANLELNDIYQLTIYLVGEMSRITQQSYNNVCDDIKEIEESI